MATSTVRNVYAQALIGVAAGVGRVDEVGTELAEFVAVLGRDQRMRIFWESPGIPAEAKQSFVREGLSAFSEETRKFLGLLVAKKRARFLPEILETYHALADERAGRQEVSCQLAVEQSNGSLDRLQAHLAKVLRKQIVLLRTTRPELIGGMRVQIGDLVLDGTLKTRLVGMRKRLLEKLN